MRTSPFMGRPVLRSRVVARTRSVGLAALSLLVPLGCASLARPVLVRQPDVLTPSAVEAGSIHILQPILFYEDVQTESEKEPEQGEIDRVGFKIIEEIEIAAAGKGFACSRDRDLAVPQRRSLAGAMDALRHDESTVWKARKRKALIEQSLGPMGESLDADLAIVSFLKVKVGRGGYWDPYSGGIYPGTSTSQLVLAIIDLRKAKVVWTNEVFARRGPDRALLGRMLEMALSGLPESRVGGT